MSILSVAVISIAMLTGQEPPQDPPASDATRIDDVEIVARQRLETRVDDFVDQVIATAPGRGPARWHRELCVGAINFQPEAARQIVDRVSAVALELGLTPGQPGCKPHVLILASNNGAEAATDLLELNRGLFIGGGTGMNGTVAELERFRTGDRPVRWWHVSTPVDIDTGQRAVRLPGDESPPVINKFAASRLYSATRDDMSNAVIILDTSRIGQASFAQIADYIALVALTRIDPAADVSGHDTILNLFADTLGVTGLTDWDWAYLHGLYDAQLGAVSRISLVGEIERAMARRERERVAAEQAAD